MADFNNMSNAELLATMQELLQQVDEKNKALAEVKEQLEKTTTELVEVKDELDEVKEQLSDVLEEQKHTQKRLDKIEEEQREMKLHLQDLYYSYTIEETLDSMARLGIFTMEAEQCKAYNFDIIENKLFTVDEDLERQYIDIDSDSSYIAQAIATKKPVVNNDFFNENIGDNQSIAGVKNVAVIPIVSKKDEVVGVVIAKNKTGGFDDRDSKHFDAREGTIGSTVCVTLENKALEQRSNTDNLTHLNNRNGAADYLKYNVLPKAKEDKPFSVIMLDIDHFKNFNDTYGHDVGDMVLKQVADVLKSNVRDMDGVFRWGGEEMIVIAEGMTAVEGYMLADRLRKSIAETPLDIGGGKTVQITTSMGVSEITPFDYARTSKNDVFTQFENVTLKLADNHLYEAKHNGRNQVCAAQDVMEQVMQVLGNEKSNVEITMFDCKLDVDTLHYKDCLLLDKDTSVAVVDMTSTNEHGKTIEINLEIAVRGDAEILYKGEWFENASDFPAALRTALECGDYSKMDIVSDNYYVCHHIATCEGQTIAENDVVWNKRNLDSKTPDELRQSLIEYAEDLIEAIEQNKELTERNTDSGKKMNFAEATKGLTEKDAPDNSAKQETEPKRKTQQEYDV